MDNANLSVACGAVIHGALCRCAAVRGARRCETVVPLCRDAWCGDACSSRGAACGGAVTPFSPRLRTLATLQR